MGRCYPNRLGAQFDPGPIRIHRTVGRRAAFRSGPATPTGLEARGGSIDCERAGGVRVLCSARRIIRSSAQSLITRSASGRLPTWQCACACPPGDGTRGRAWPGSCPRPSPDVVPRFRGRSRRRGISARPARGRQAGSVPGGSSWRRNPRGRRRPRRGDSRLEGCGADREAASERNADQRDVVQLECVEDSADGLVPFGVIGACCSSSTAPWPGPSNATTVQPTSRIVVRIREELLDIRIEPPEDHAGSARAARYEPPRGQA